MKFWQQIQEIEEENERLKALCQRQERVIEQLQQRIAEKEEQYVGKQEIS